MTINAADLPRHVLGSIFSCLDPQSLSRAAQVCRTWNEAQGADWVWQNVARSILDFPTTPQCSWKGQCQTLHSWKAGKATEVLLSTSPRFFKQDDDFVILEDNTAVEVVRTRCSRPVLYSVRNLANGQELGQIDPAKEGCERPFGVDSALYGTTWVILDANGKIFQFDIRTGTCINKFRGDFRPGMTDMSSIYCNDHEIVTTVENWVQIWDLQQRGLSQTFQISEDQRIFRTRSTQNFVLCSVSQSESFFILAINKKDPSVRIRTEGEVDPVSLESNGTHCSFLTREGELHVYEDTPDAQFRLVRTHRIHEAPCKRFEAVQMYRNWVCVRKDDVLRIFDVRTGAEIATLKKEDWRTKGLLFRINAQMLLVCRMPGDLDPVQEKSYILYDFAGRIRRLPTEDIRLQQTSSWKCPVM
jgi:hypothetical protein